MPANGQPNTWHASKVSNRYATSFSTCAEMWPTNSPASIRLRNARLGGPNLGIGTEVIDEDVRINENGVAWFEIGERHGDSSEPNSSSSAIFRSASTSPVQPISPY